MRRIVICGCSGAGKSTLAVWLGQRRGLPVVHLDPLFWRPGWTKPDIGEFRDRVRAATAGDAWICDGNYAAATFDLTLPRADAIIIIERSRWVCLLRVIWRTYVRRARPDLPAGCPNRTDRDLLHYIWNYASEGGARVEAFRQVYGPDVPLIRLRGNRDIAGFMRRLTDPASEIPHPGYEASGEAASPASDALTGAGHAPISRRSSWPPESRAPRPLSRGITRPGEKS